jgi:transposase InsO family protein
MNIGMLCGLFGLSRQAYYQHKEDKESKEMMRSLLLGLVTCIRAESPRIGCRKLYEKIKSLLGKELCMGRDAFYSLLAANGLMLKMKKRNKVRTTDSRHIYPTYPNLVKGLILTSPFQVWVSDITYIALSTGRFCYLSLITDAYTHRIVGWTLSSTLEYRYTVEALRMAIVSAGHTLQGLIHHSDRGGQYAHPAYIRMLREQGIRSSMTQGDPRDNATAERINGIVKQEGIRGRKFGSIEEAGQALEDYIDFYNNRRPHSSIDFLTPRAAADMDGLIKNRWKKKSTLQKSSRTASRVMENRST